MKEILEREALVGRVWGGRIKCGKERRKEGLEGRKMIPISLCHRNTDLQSSYYEDRY